MRSNFIKKGFLIISLLTFVGAAGAVQSGGRLVTTSGQVLVNGKPAKAGDTVPAGAKIETAKGASASIIFTNETVVNITSNSEITVDGASGKSVNINLVKGVVDGVKKVGSPAGTSVVVKTQSAVFELNSGRYSVGNDSGGSASGSFVAVDGNASLTFLKDTEDGQSAGSKMALDEGAFVMVSPTAGSGSGAAAEGGPAVALEKKSLTEKEAQSLRPSQEGLPSAEERAQQLVSAVSQPNSTPTVSDRSPASSGDSTTGTRDRLQGDLNGGTIGNIGSPLPPSIPRDPYQTLPGKSEAAVKVIFQP